MPIKETDRKARENYRKKVEIVRFELYPTETDIKEQISKRAEAGETKSGYIKRLIREDINRSK